ncbi:hypothetical protein IW261DRAFT_1566837 [Armillaria novae-zelandiae]|uniref:Uncharacterized protein n=1 Tax=Armillaria novae-zelandiae TaxID=153914 RepID=A0AA39P392_9AGAR|nr:hypothetical protein IW261DRAFT_1566837 [Armillaria novae-zelandiae]
MFLNLIVTEMESNRLGVLRCQQSLEYLHEPDVLFTLRKTLFALDATNLLRRLAFFRPKDPAWDDCIQRLQDLQSPKWGYDQHVRILTAFKAFIEAGCPDVSASGMHDDPHPEIGVVLREVHVTVSSSSNVV